MPFDVRYFRSQDFCIFHICSQACFLLSCEFNHHLDLSARSDTWQEFAGLTQPSHLFCRYRYCDAEPIQQHAGKEKPRTQLEHPPFHSQLISQDRPCIQETDPQPCHARQESKAGQSERQTPDSLLDQRLPSRRLLSQFDFHPTTSRQ